MTTDRQAGYIYCWILSLGLLLYLAVCNVAVKVEELDCSFEKDFCEWTAVNFKRYNYDHTLKSNSGPEEAQDKAYYIHLNYTEYVAGFTGTLTSQVIGQTTSNVCFRFWYHMYGTGMGTLSLYKGENKEKIWTKSGNQNNQWHCAAHLFQTAPKQISFEAVIGNSLYSVIAVDNIEIFVNTPCDIQGTMAAKDGSQYSHLDFLRERGVEETILKVLKEEKVDIETVNLLEDDSLSKYVPTLGDRVMLKEYCKSFSKKATLSKKDSLFTILKKKMKPFDQKKGALDLPSCSRSSQNLKQNALKATRKIELGWIHEGRPLRKTSGGGTRKIILDKNALNKDICEKGKEIFFRNGNSSKGAIDLFEFSVLDFQKIPMPDGVTIGDVQELSKMSGYLRFYLSTTCKKIEGDKTTTTASTDSSGTPQKHTIEENTIIFGPSTSTPTSAVLAETLPLEESETSSLASLGSDISRSSSLEQLLNDPLPADIVAQAMALESIGEQFHQNTNPIIEIRAHRGQVFKDLISFFKSVNIGISKNYEVKMILPNGQEEAGEDNGGIFRDALSEFWDTFYQRCTLGEIVRVPATIHTMKEDDWQAVCKVIYIGYKQQKLFPNRIAVPFVKYCMTGDSKGTSPEDLLTVFLRYLPELDNQTLKAALSDFDSVDSDDLLELLTSLEVRTKPTKENIRNVLAEVAHKKLVQDPAFVADCWRPLFQNFICPLLPADISELYASLELTVKKLLSLLKFPNDMSREQDETKNYLQKFVKSLPGSMLEKFLRFCTGSNVVINNAITIRFVASTSVFSRRPVAHTCGCVLELPYSYQNYIEFRQEFNSILESNIWIMDFI